MVIGITGNSGSGKTVISSIIAKKMKAKIIDADSIVKEFRKKGNPYYEEIIKLFGNDILMDDENIDTRALAKIIYKSKKSREKLNKITQEYVVEEIISRIRNMEDENIILDIPLLFESGLDKMCNATIAILAKENIKFKRIILRDKIIEKEAKKRLKIQPKDKYYINHANYIIENNEEDDLVDKVEKVCEDICLKHGKN